MTLEGYISRVHTSQIAGRNQPVAVVRFCNVWPEEEDSLEILQSALFRLIKKLSVKLLCALDLSFFFQNAGSQLFQIFVILPVYGRYMCTYNSSRELCSWCGSPALRRPKSMGGTVASIKANLTSSHCQG